MAPRRERFERLLSLRTHELHLRLSDQARAKGAVRDTRIALENAQNELRDAAKKYRVPDGGERIASDFIDAGAWLKSKVYGVEQALGTHQLALERQRSTTQQVERAEREKLKIEKVLERIRKEEQKELIATEQKETDELAQVVLGRKNSP